MSDQILARVLSQLADTIEQRRAAGEPDASYVAKLQAKGLDAMLKKVGEEATEFVMAAKDGDRDKLIYEAADLWFHTLLALADFGLRPEAVTVPAPASRPRRDHAETTPRQHPIHAADTSAHRTCPTATCVPLLYRGEGPPSLA